MTTPLKVYTNNRFPGHWLRGSAVVVAASPEEAQVLLLAELVNQGLGAEVAVEDFVEVQTTHRAAYVLDDGDY